MTDEFNIVDDKTPEEKRVEKFSERLERMAESERLGKLVRHETSTIDIIIGILMQAKGWINLNRSTADLVDDHIEDVFDIVRDMVRLMNEEAKGDRDGRTD